MTELGPAPATLLLDAGNTLVFFHADAAAEVLKARGVVAEGPKLEAAIPEAVRHYEKFLRNGGSHDEGWFEWTGALLRHGVEAELAPDRLTELVGELRRSHDELNLWRKVRPGTEEALEALQTAGIQLGVISNSEGAIVELLEKVGLAKYFETIIDSGRVGVNKPDERIFRIALEQLNATAETSVYVGDVPAVDVDGARAAGLRAVLIDGYGHHPNYQAAPIIGAVGELADAWA